MAGAGKRRAKTGTVASSSGGAENQTESSGQRVSPDEQSAPRSSPSSLPKFDGNRDPQQAPALNVDTRGMGETIGVAGWYAARGIAMPDGIPRRPAKLNTQGREINVKLNTFNVAAIPSKPVYQYDVIIGSGAEKRGLIKAVWTSKTLQANLGPGWLFDGNKIAWSLSKKSDINITVDLDVERGRNVRPERKGKNAHRVFMRSTKVVRFDLLQAYLNRKADYDNEVTEAIIFLDHLMRETPSAKYTQIKKSFFARGQVRAPLGGSLEAFKGVFSSMRVACNAANMPGLSVNVDVANGTFWVENGLMQTVLQMLNMNDKSTLVQAVAQANHQNTWERGMLKQNLKRVSKLSVQVNHRGLDTETKSMPEFIIDKIIPRTAHEYKFEIKDKNPDGSEKRQWVTIADYFRSKYQITLINGLPLVKMTKKDIVMPMDVCKVMQNQRYPFKLNEKQTSQMIRFAVTPPAERWASIEHGLKMLNWSQDPFLAQYGLKIDPNPVVVKARQLQAPQVMFGGAGNQAHIQPNEAAKGRWMLLGKKFFAKNPVPLTSWGVCVIQGRGSVDPDTTRRFFNKFMEIYVKHGGNVQKKEFALVPGNIQKGPDMVAEVWNATGNRTNTRPQLLFFVVPDRNADTYNRVKKICECRYGVVSQFLQATHVAKCQDQYISNVCMKVNSKLGGITSRAVGNLNKIAPNAGKIPTMCIGADVSHPAPGAAKDGSVGSFAAITMSLNETLTRYAAQCDTNGFRVEMISTSNIDQLLGKMVTYWMNTVGRGTLPARVMYFRDGVSEAQYQHVLEQEVRDMKALFNRLNPKNQTKFVVIVASKRHHVRFFPDKQHSDRNGNPNPGTLVETGVTHPFQFDFYLAAHSAIKGTARPVHYTVIMNEANMGADEIQQMIFEHSFQYARSTTPVSLFPAVYYAHLASQRARGHANERAPSSGKKQTAEKKDTATSTSEKTPTEVAPIAQMLNTAGIDFSMWYI